MSIKIAINGNELEKNIYLLKQINYDCLIPVESKIRINARIYYVFKNHRGKKIFDVTMWGEVNSNYVNGYDFEGEDIFYDILISLLFEDDSKYFREL